MNKLRFFMLSFVLLMICIFSNIHVNAKAEENSIVNEVIQAINNEDIAEYISLFDSENQLRMNDYVKNNGSEEFFREENVELLNVKQLSYDTGILAASITADEIEKYDNMKVYYTKEKVALKGSAEDIQDEIQYKVYVVGVFDGIEEMLRISEPIQKSIIEAEEQFLGDNIALIESRAALYQPSTISVYFTKAENSAYHNGQVRANIDFNTYLKNVIPNEWTVSYYQYYPEYLKAGALASKTYGWYQVIVHKYGFAPYYTDVLDNSSDQNYLATSYANIGSLFQPYVDAVMSVISNKVILKGAASTESNIFEVQYHETDGDEHSGKMSASEALNDAIDGMSYVEILKKYYDYCPKADGNAIVIGSHF